MLIRVIYYARKANFSREPRTPSTTSCGRRRRSHNMENALVHPVVGFHTQHAHEYIGMLEDEPSHQALDMKYPTELYRPSPRPYRGLDDLGHLFHDRTITVTHCDRIWNRPFRSVSTKDDTLSRCRNAGFKHPKLRLASSELLALYRAANCQAA